MPDWLDSEVLQDVSVGVLVALAVGALLVLRFVTKLVTRLVALALIAAVGVGVWLERDDLGECAETCECSVFGQDVEVPACEDRLRGE